MLHLEVLKRVLVQTALADNVWGFPQIWRQWYNNNVKHTWEYTCIKIKLLYCIQFSENDFQLRTQDRHLDQLCDMEDDETGEKSKEYGINYRSSLLSLNYFDLCGGVLLPDIMHDILEGALQHEPKLLLQNCVCTQHYVQVYNSINLIIILWCLLF